MPSEREELRRRVEECADAAFDREVCPLCGEDGMGCACAVLDRAIAELLLKIDKLEGHDERR